MQDRSLEVDLTATENTPAVITTHLSIPISTSLSQPLHTGQGNHLLQLHVHVFVWGYNSPTWGSYDTDFNIYKACAWANRLSFSERGYRSQGQPRVGRRSTESTLTTSNWTRKHRTPWFATLRSGYLTAIAFGPICGLVVLMWWELRSRFWRSILRVLRRFMFLDETLWEIRWCSWRMAC